MSVIKLKRPTNTITQDFELSELEQTADILIKQEYDSDDEERLPNNVSPGTPMRSKVEEAIADFYESNPLFYDRGHPDYKNKDKKKMLLGNFCKTLGMGVDSDDVIRKFTSHRTDYVKLKKFNTWSGKSALTSLQRWKLDRYQFLDPYCATKPIRLGDDGSVPSIGALEARNGAEDEEVKEDDDDDELACGTSLYGISALDARLAKRQASPSGSRPPMKKNRPNTPTLVDVLTKLVQDHSNGEDKRTTQDEVRHSSSNATEVPQPMDERVAWGQWLMATCLRVPSEHFQQYQRDTFEASLRWIPREPATEGIAISRPSTLAKSQRQVPQQASVPHNHSQPKQKSRYRDFHRDRSVESDEESPDSQ